jgi:hypothetical protein
LFYRGDRGTKGVEIKGYGLVAWVAEAYRHSSLFGFVFILEFGAVRSIYKCIIV